MMRYRTDACLIGLLAASLGMLTGCDVGTQVVNTVLLALQIAGVWV